VPTFRVVAKYQPRLGHELFGRFRDLVTSSRLKWTHDCNPDGTGHITKLLFASTGALFILGRELIKALGRTTY
jgi:hypothetical protein